MTFWSIKCPDFNNVIFKINLPYSSKFELNQVCWLGGGFYLATSIVLKIICSKSGCFKGLKQHYSMLLFIQFQPICLYILGCFDTTEPYVTAVFIYL